MQSPSGSALVIHAVADEHADRHDATAARGRLLVLGPVSIYRAAGRTLSVPGEASDQIRHGRYGRARAPTDWGSIATVG